MALGAEDETPSDPLPLTHKIGRNHGHALELSLTDLILVLREVDLNGPVDLDIQGESNHPHALLFDRNVIEEILIQGQTVIISSDVAGHTHAVLIELKPS